MDVLRDQGLRFALDDLGSEYSTLSAMSDLPFDTVKLDRLLVKRFIDDSMSSSHRGGNRACLREERHPLRGGGRRAALLHRTAGVFGMPIRSGVLLRAPDDRRPVHQRVPCAKRRHRGCQSHPAAWKLERSETMDDNVRETARDIESADDRGAGIEAKEAERRHDSEHKNLIVGVGASAGALRCSSSSSTRCRVSAAARSSWCSIFPPIIAACCPRYWASRPRCP